MLSRVIEFYTGLNFSIHKFFCGLSLTLIASTLLFTHAAYMSMEFEPGAFPNGGFETFPLGGSDDWDWPDEDWIWDSNVAHSGSHSAYVSRSAGPSTDFLWSARIPVQPSMSYTLAYWLRVEDASWAPAVEVFQYMSDGTQIGPRLRSWMDVGEGDRDWFPVALRFQTMPDVDYIRVRIYLWSDTQGAFWFDDFALNGASPAPYPLQSGFPVVAPGWVRYSSPAVADIDNDSKPELLIGGGGSVGGWDIDGTALAGFPISTGDERIIGQIAIADLDEDSDLEIAAGTRTSVYGDRGRVFIWHHTGIPLDGWPQSVDWLGQYGTDISEVYSVVLADIDGDDDLEVLAGTTNGAPDYWGAPGIHEDIPETPNLYAWHVDGSFVAGDWPNGHRTAAIYGAIAAGDLTGDGKSEVITGRDHHYLHAYAGDGTSLPGWPITTYLNANVGDYSIDIRIGYTHSAPVLADLDGDGTTEYIVVGDVSGPGNISDISNSGILVLKSNGTRWPGWETAALGDGILWDEYVPQQAPAIADLDQDGRLEIVVATHDGWIRAYKTDQAVLWGFNYTQGDLLFASEPVIGDIDGDQAPEIVFGTYDPKLGEGAVGLWALEADGIPVSGFPLAVGSPGIRAAPTLSDLDNDGDLEILAASWTGEIFVWDTPAPYSSAHLPWPTGRHDLRRSASYACSQTSTDFSLTRKFAFPVVAWQGESTTFTIRIQATSDAVPLTPTIHLTDTIPAGLSYVPGSLVATQGYVTETAGTIEWHSILSGTLTVDITYAATVTTPKVQLITNTVFIDTVFNGIISRTGYVYANGISFFLPVIVK